MNPRGGYRPGAGRKRIAEKLLDTDEPTVIVRARVPQSYKAALAKLGKGVVSVGIRFLVKEHLRRALDMAMAAEERSEEDE